MTPVRPPRKPKILIVGAFPAPGSKVVGGVLRNCQLLVESAFSERYDLSFVDSTQRSNPPPGLFMRLVYAVGRWARYLQTLVRHRPDFTMVFAGTGLSLVEKGLMAAVGRLCGATSVFFPMGGQMIDKGQDDLRLQRWYRWCLAPAQVLFCQGQMWVDFLHDKLGIASDRLVIVNSWTATPDLLAIGAARTVSATRTASGDGWVTMTFIGWVEREKGILELMDAFADVARTQRVRLHVIGGGSLEGAVQEAIARHGLADRVTTHGWLPPTRVAQLLSESDVFVLPTWAEGIPNSLIEAMSTKAAVIISRVGTIPDYVTSGEHGLLIAPRSVPELREALERMATDGALRQRCADQAYAVARSEFAIEKALSQMHPTFARET